MKLPFGPLLLALVPLGAARAQGGPSYEERRDADCIDVYNETHDLGSDVENTFARNPWRIRLLAGVRSAAPQAGDTALAQESDSGATVDVDLPMQLTGLFGSSGSTDLGMLIGLNFSIWKTGSHVTDAVGNLRVGMFRRRFQPAWGSPRAGEGNCRRVRTELGLNFLDWRLGTFTDPSVPGSDAVWTSSVGLLSLAYRSENSTWGLGAGVVVAEIRVAPTIQPGFRLFLDLDHAVLGVRAMVRSELFLHWRCGWPAAYLSLLLGIRLDLGGG